MRALLTFHSIDDDGSVLSFAPSALRGLLRGIRESGHAVVSLRTLLAEPSVPNRVALSFDDGFRSVHSEALPILREAGATATLFLTTGHLGGENDWPSQPSWAPRLAMLGWPEVAELVQAGWEIQSHTVHHPDLRTYADSAIRAELAAADAAIARASGRQPDCFAYPYGRHDARVAAIAGERYAHIVTTQLAPLDGRSPESLRRHGIPRLDSYYLRDARLQRSFGSRRMRAYLAARAALRWLRG